MTSPLRRSLAQKKNKDILIHFINDMVTFKENGPIKEVFFLKTNQDPETAAHKSSIVDILCKDQKGNQYIVEMQVAKEKGFEKRAQYYASKAYISQSQVGGEYCNLKEVIFLAIADFIMFPNKKSFKSDHIILDKESYENDLKDFSFTFLELPKFHKNIDQLTNIIDKWVYFFKHAEETTEDDLYKIIGSDQIIERAYDELNRFSWNEEELLTYEQAEKYAGCYQASMAQKFDEGLEQGKKEGTEQGKKEGRKQGKKEGREQGKKEGIEQGKKEGREQGKKEVALAMISQGIAVEVVAAITGFTTEEVKKLS